jgi:hypothetical protein
MAEFVKNMNDSTLDPALKLKFLERMLARAESYKQTQAARLKMMNYPVPGEDAAAPAGGSGATGGGEPVKPADIPQEEWDAMPPEDKALFQ